jgi:hypothetical protein
VREASEVVGRHPDHSPVVGWCAAWTEDEARRKLAELERSGLSLVAWSSQEGVSPQRLYYWRDRLALAHRPLPQLVEVAVRPQPHPVGGSIEVVWPSGHVVRVPVAVYPTHLPHLPGEAGPSDAGRRRVGASVERGGGTGAARCVRSERDVADCVERSGRSQPAARVLLA